MKISNNDRKCNTNTWLLRMLIAVIGALFIGQSSASAQLSMYYLERFNVRNGDFTLGELNGQRGWVSVPGQAHVVRGGEGGQRFGVKLDSSGMGYQTLVQSPQFASIPDITGDDYTLSILAGFKSTDVTWYITPKNVSNNTIVSRLKFDRDGHLYVFIPNGEGGGGYTVVPNFTWVRNHTYQIYMVFRGNGLLQLGIDNRLAASFEGAWSGYGIEQISIESDNSRPNRTMYFDRIKVRSGRML